MSDGERRNRTTGKKEGGERGVKMKEEKED